MNTATKNTLLATLTAILALGAAQAYAADNVLIHDDGESRAWRFDKTAVTTQSAIDTPTVMRRVEDAPDLIVPLNTDIDMRAVPTSSLARPASYGTRTDLTDFDIVDDETLFIGAQGRSEFDTLDAQRDRAAFPDNLNVDPMVPVAGAGLATAF